MSAKERDRLKVLHEVRKRHITQKQAGVELGLSVRWVRTLLKRLRKEGDRALRHRLRGIRVNRETLRQWLIAAKLWRARRSRIERAHIWPSQACALWRAGAVGHQ